MDSLFILEFGKEFEIISSSDLPVISEIVRPEVFETVLSLALGILIEAKEIGKYGSFLRGEAVGWKRCRSIRTRPLKKRGREEIASETDSWPFRFLPEA